MEKQNIFNKSNEVLEDTSIEGKKNIEILKNLIKEPVEKKTSLFARLKSKVKSFISKIKNKFRQIFSKKSTDIAQNNDFRNNPNKSFNETKLDEKKQQEKNTQEINKDISPINESEECSLDEEGINAGENEQVSDKEPQSFDNEDKPIQSNKNDQLNDPEKEVENPESLNYNSSSNLNEDKSSKSSKKTKAEKKAEKEAEKKAKEDEKNEKIAARNRAKAKVIINEIQYPQNLSNLGYGPSYIVPETNIDNTQKSSPVVDKEDDKEQTSDQTVNAAAEQELDPIKEAKTLIEVKYNEACLGDTITKFPLSDEVYAAFNPVLFSDKEGNQIPICNVYLCDSKTDKCLDVLFRTTRGNEIKDNPGVYEADKVEGSYEKMLNTCAQIMVNKDKSIDQIIEELRSKPQNINDKEISQPNKNKDQLIKDER